MPRVRVEWKIGNEIWRLGERTLIGGVVEAWPPPERGVRTHEEPDRAFVRANELIDAGASFIEIAVERYAADHTTPPPPHLAVETEHRNAEPRVRLVRRLDHIVLLVALEPVLWSHGGGNVKA